LSDGRTFERVPLFAFELPRPPRGKGRPRFGQSGKGGGARHAFTDRSTLLFENAVASLAMDAALKAGVSVPLDEPLGVGLVFAIDPPKKRKHRTPAVRPDVDNLAKAVLDGLNLSGVWVDDARVVELVARKEWATGAPCVRVRVYRVVA
jgi:Holliday junction resolvase RusA-like endonuclease